MNLLTVLHCPRCEHAYPANQIQTFCPDCRAPLLAQYDLERATVQFDRDEFARRPAGMWRWHELLPVTDPAHITSLGEGDTPVIRLTHLGEALGLPNLFLKDESRNPTGTFKARGLAAAISKAYELGVEKVIIPTAGNAGGAMAAYAARAGLRACVLMPQSTPIANYEECRIAGAEVIQVEGLINDAARLAAEKARLEGWFDLSTFKEPYRVEGKKVMGYELAEAFDWELPEVIIYPTGGGTGLVGMWKAFAELVTLGWLADARLPRMVAVQASGCAPVVKAFEADAETCTFWEDAHTIASGLCVPLSFADRLILRCIKDSHGCAVAVDDAEILFAQRRLARGEGIFAAPEGAATLAGLTTLLQQGWIDPGERIVLFNTGSGLKYLS
jgi:threonine synthase